MKKIFILVFALSVLAISIYFFPYHSSPPLPPPQKPKILFTNSHPNYTGGLLSYIVSIIKSDLNNQFEFAVAVPETSDIYKACNKLGIKTYPCDFPFKFKELPQVLTACKTLRSILKEYNPDIIHANGSHDRTLAVWNSQFLKNKPSIVQTFHSVKVVSKDPYHWLFYNKLISANMFVSPSAFKVNTEKRGLKLDNVHIIENGIDLEKFKPFPKNNSLKEQLHIPGNYFVFGSNAGLAQCKGIELMLEALTLFPPDSPLKVVLLGPNPQPWIEKAKSLGVDHFIIFAGYHEDVRPFCSFFDSGFILSTRDEGSSFASREMMAMGIPLISSFYGGLKDNVDNHVNGIFVKPGNVQDVYTAMNHFLNMSPAELERYKRNARLKAERSFDAKDQLQAIRKLYESLLNKSTINQNVSIPTPVTAFAY